MTIELGVKMPCAEFSIGSFADRMVECWSGFSEYFGVPTFEFHDSCDCDNVVRHGDYFDIHVNNDCAARVMFIHVPVVEGYEDDYDGGCWADVSVFVRTSESKFLMVFTAIQMAKYVKSSVVDDSLILGWSRIIDCSEIFDLMEKSKTNDLLESSNIFSTKLIN
ncbi:hypothetical protein [Sphingomonas colocasiae]|uniref:Uncharacterized protein n=1 Tax=Sphingomonas colocasiae TaxID=1848973 RepID=A0ABS7PVD5_9SPHN|nr:hypothetical protein [Sphingomonas colocasiae]MBY8825324.1 hypothetical protein [Sphingomonas colocasiae]